jgi:hypothetical protein
MIRDAAAEGGTESDLSHRIASILHNEVLSPLGLSIGRYETAVGKYSEVQSNRIDALHSFVVIEYEKAHTFESATKYQHSIQQVEDGIRGHAADKGQNPAKYFGVALDGLKIGFVKYKSSLKRFETSRQPLDVNSQTIARFVEALVGLSRKALDAEELLRDFGPGSQVSKQVIATLYKAIHGKLAARTAMLFTDWKRVFSQVCAYESEKISGLEKEYPVSSQTVDPEELLFSLHTYLALLMKLLAAEVSSLYWPIMGSYLRALEEAYQKGPDDLRVELTSLEEGGLFSKLGISNFLEADYFAWYLDEWNQELAASVALVIGKLSEYDPSTGELEPERVKDLFKRLYQNLLPKKIRHDLGEYYTPDWLAELLLDEVGYSLVGFEKMSPQNGGVQSPLDLRLLDPACGSGTFLVLAVGRLREYLNDHWDQRTGALEKITSNVVGFDLNPLAVMASRANYLISIGDLLRERGSESIEIPVYLADSILVERRPTVLGSSTYSLRSAVGDFLIPVSVVEKGLLVPLLDLVGECVRLGCTTAQFLQRLGAEIRPSDDETHSLKDFYARILTLSRQGKDGIWLRVLKNSFAPLLQKPFDIIAGNPPWINWESLPESYRDSTKNLWEHYGLFTLGGQAARLGGGKKDIAMLFTYVASDKYLKHGGILGFLITQSVFKTKGAADGFRRFAAGETRLKVLRVHDLVSLKPFEGAANRTSMIVLQKGEATTYPVSYVLWQKSGPAIQMNASLSEVYSGTTRHQLLAQPIVPSAPRSPWLNALPASLDALSKVLGVSRYEGYEGANTGGANGVFWIKVLQRWGENHVVIENESDVGKRKFRRVQAQIEDELVYPLLRGRDILDWGVKPSTWIILAQDPSTRVGIPLSRMRTKLPKTLGYLSEFKDELLSRKSSSIDKDPFYSMFGVGNYTLKKWKVVWAREAGRIEAAVCSTKTDSTLGSKTIIPDQTVMFIPFDTEDEAHFVCAILNSSPIRLVPMAYTIDITTHLLEVINIPRFDGTSALHKSLAAESKSAHSAASREDLEALSSSEASIDRLVAKLYGLSDEELGETIKSLDLMSGGIESEEEGPD